MGLGEKSGKELYDSGRGHCTKLARRAINVCRLHDQGSSAYLTSSNKTTCPQHDAISSPTAHRELLDFATALACIVTYVEGLL